MTVELHQHRNSVLLTGEGEMSKVDDDIDSGPKMQANSSLKGESRGNKSQFVS